MERTRSFGLSRKCVPGKIDVQKLLQTMNEKPHSHPVDDDEETRILEDTAMELQNIITQDCQKRDSNLTSINGCSRQTPPVRAFDTILEEKEDVVTDDLVFNDGKPDVDDNSGSLFDSETSDLEAEETSHEIVYSAMTQLVQPKDVNLANLKDKLMDVENENVSQTLRKLNKTFKIVSHLSFSCIFVYYLYALFFPF